MRAKDGDGGRTAATAAATAGIRTSAAAGTLCGPAGSASCRAPLPSSGASRTSSRNEEDDDHHNDDGAEPLIAVSGR